jgi:hypothetical protein
MRSDADVHSRSYLAVVCAAVLLARCVATTVVPASASSSSAGSAWSITPSPNTTREVENRLSSVACADATNCWAVGHHSDTTTGFSNTLIQHDLGTGWQVVDTPSSSSFNELNAVTCPSAANCWAVGDHLSGAIQTLIEQNTGNGWTTVPSPNVGSFQVNYLLGVSCVNVADCWAVGYYGTASADQTLIEHNTGSGWEVVKSPDTSPAESNRLFAVDCVVAGYCFAVGSSYNGVAGQTLIEQLTGSGWGIVSSANVPSARGNQLNAVTCDGASTCWAVGNSLVGAASETLIEQNTPSGWVIVNSPNATATGDNNLNAVTCVSVAHCLAVGSYSGPGVQATLIEENAGGNWTIASSPNAPSASLNELLGVSCGTSTRCVAVGDFSDATRGVTYQSLIEEDIGTGWTIVVSPEINASQDNALNGMTCLGVTDCWAVGYYVDRGGNFQHTLAAHYTMGGWAIVQSPSTLPDQDNSLRGVACVTATDCWAVGSYYNFVTSQTLIEHFDGTGWSIVMSPNAGIGEFNLLMGVACAQTGTCVAVGVHVDMAHTSHTLILENHGTGWVLVTSPDGSTAGSTLNSVTCTTSTNCWAVGASGSQTLIERNAGSGWNTVTSPNAVAGQNQTLSGITCSNDTDCWAVGYSAGFSSQQTLIAHNAASGWQIVASPNAAFAQQNTLNSVSCVDSSDCWAVGYSSTGYPVKNTLTVQYTGGAWSVVSSPNSGRGANTLAGVVCLAAADCRAVGSFELVPEFQLQTLIEQYGLGSAPDLPVEPMGASIAATEGLEVTRVVASFTDPDPAAVAGEYEARIDWGDGSVVATAAVVSGANGSFAVQGSHTYGEEGLFRITTTITDADTSSNTGTAIGMANVSDNYLLADGRTIVSADPVNAVVATFHDADPGGVTSDYTTTIDWGDGSAASSGTVTLMAGGFAVTGRHSYTALGPHDLTVVICDVGGTCFGVSSHALVFGVVAGGAFVVGDQTVSAAATALGRSVYYWGSQWSAINRLSGGPAPASFKGFEDSTSIPTCGLEWITGPGNGPEPPASVPVYMPVLVASNVTRQGKSTIGDVVSVVIVRTDPGYEPTPGAAGRGTIVGILC